LSKRFVAVLAVLVLALGGYVLVFERGSLTSKQLDERKSKALRTFVRDQVSRLSVTRAGATIALERKQEADGSFAPWKLTAPAGGPADQDTVDKLLGELEWLAPRRVLDDVSAADRAKFGLDKPRFRFGYRSAGTDYVVSVGGVDANGESHYMSVAGEPSVYVVPKTVIEALDHEVSQFRAKEFLGDITSAWAQRVTLRSGDQTLTLQKEDERWWLLNEPKSWADTQRVEQLVAALDSLRALRFLEGPARMEALVDLGRAAHSIELHVIPDTHREDKAAQRFLLRLGGACKGHEGERYAQAGEGDPVCVRAEDVVRLEASEPELRQMGLLGVDPSQIEAIALSAGSDSWSFKREGEKWLGQGLPTSDREAVEMWLNDLSAERASAVVPALAKAKGTRLLLTLGSGKKLGLTADSSAPDQVLVQRDGEPVALRFPAALADLLRPMARRFAGLALWPSLQPSQVTGISAQSGKLTRKLALVDGNWVVSGKGAPAVEGLQLRELVRDVAKLSALSIVAEHARPEHGVDGSGVALNLELGAGKSALLELGAATPRGVLARVDHAYVVLLGPEVTGLVQELAGGEPVARAAGSAEAGEDEDEDEHEDAHAHDDAHPHE
jgi:hypothetical protein